MVARITAAEAKRLGIDPQVGRTRTTRRVAKGVAYRTRCMAQGCGEEFVTQAAETRHLESTRHARYQIVP